MRSLSSQGRGGLWAWDHSIIYLACVWVGCIKCICTVYIDSGFLIVYILFVSTLTHTRTLHTTSTTHLHQDNHIYILSLSRLRYTTSVTTNQDLHHHCFHESLNSTLVSHLWACILLLHVWQHIYLTTWQLQLWSLNTSNQRSVHLPLFAWAFVNRI